MSTTLLQARPDLADKVLELREAHPKVTDKQADLVDQIVTSGESIRQCAMAISANERWAYTTMKKQHVLNYAYDLGRAVLAGHALSAIARMGSLLNARSEYVQMQAAQDILDRTGMKHDAGATGRQASINITLDLGGPRRVIPEDRGV